MAKTSDTTNPADPVVLPPPATPAQGGSYVVDAKTGEHILTERTQESNKE